MERGEKFCWTVRDNALEKNNNSVACLQRVRLRVYRDQNSPGGVVETETGEIEVADGSDSEPVKREGRMEPGGRERYGK